VAVPKKRTSVSRKGLRWAGHTFKIPLKAVGTCTNCGALTRPHHACPSCGFYKGKQIFTIRVRKKDQENADTSNGSQTQA